MFRKFVINWSLTFLTWSIFFVVSAVNIVVGVVVQLIALPFDPQRRTALWVNRWIWGNILFWVEPTFPIERDGLEHLGAGPYVIVSNHISALDIPAGMGLPLALRVAAKASLFGVPVLGWYMRFSKQIAIDRGGDSAAIVATLRDCQDSLDNGISVLFFPEGTRSVDTHPLPFRRGAFRIAKDTNTLVLPIAVYGSQYTLAKNSVLPSRGYAPIKVRVLPPIDPANSKTARALSNRAREAIIAGVDDLRAEIEPRGRFLAEPDGRPTVGLEKSWW